jgi:hypothetical protein
MNDFTESEFEYLELTKLMLEEGMIQPDTWLEPLWRSTQKLKEENEKLELSIEELRRISKENIKRIVELTSKLKLDI